MENDGLNPTDKKIHSLYKIVPRPNVEEFSFTFFYTRVSKNIYRQIVMEASLSIFLPGVRGHIISYFTDDDKLFAEGRIHEDRLLSYAASNGDLKLAKRLHGGEHWYHSSSFRKAAEYGHLEVLIWADTKGYTFDEFISISAVIGGQIRVLEWLAVEGHLWRDPTLCYRAARRGDLSTLQWLRLHNCPWDENTCIEAAGYGHLPVLKWAKENKCPCGVSVCSQAAVKGKIEIIKWLRQNNCPWDEETCVSAARGNQLKTLQWVRQNGCPWNEKACRHAALLGNIRVLKWLRLNGCPWNVSRCYYARDFVNQAIRKKYPRGSKMYKLVEEIHAFYFMSRI